jgi:hypothetical protein
MNPTPIIEEMRVRADPLKLPVLIGPNHLYINGLYGLLLSVPMIYFVLDILFENANIFYLLKN